MTVEENKELVRRFFEAQQEFFRTGNVDFLDDLLNFLAPDFVHHSQGVSSDKERRRQALPMYRAAFPDAQMIIEDMIAEGDKVVVRIIVRGTHQGELMAIPPTGKQITLTVIHIVRIADDKIVERWEEWDQMVMMRQIGAIPS